MKSLKLAIVGAGLVGRRHAAAIAKCKNVSLAAIADPDESARAHLSSDAKWHRSLSDLFADSKPDGVIISTPNQMHLENGLECVRAGCPMLIEKPIATSAAEGKTLTQAAAAAGVPVLVGHHRRYNSRAQKAREILDSGELGELRAMHANCWLYKPDDYFDNAWRKQKGAGPVSVNLVHDADLMRYFCGEAESVQAQSVPALRGFDNEDVAAAVLRFASGVLGTMTISDSIVAPWSWELTAGENPAYPNTGQSCYWLGGSRGALSLPDLTLWKNHGARSWWRPMNPAAISCDKTADPLVAQIRHFADVISGKTPPLVSGEEGVRTLQVIECILQSAASGETIKIPPDNKTTNSER